MMKQFTLNKIELGGYAFIFGINLVGWYLSAFAPASFEAVVAEDGFVESSTALILFLISLLLMIRFAKIKFSKGWLWGCMQLFLIILFVFGAGEEISWGQRIFQIESTEFFQKNNSQGETNFHNLVVGDYKINKIVFGQMFTVALMLYFFVILYAYRKFGWVHRLANQWGIPVGKVHHSVAFMFIIASVTIITASKKWELYEFSFSLLLLLIFLYPYNPEISRKHASNAKSQILKSQETSEMPR
jgi:hypothetical protein